LYEFIFTQPSGVHQSGKSFCVCNESKIHDPLGYFNYHRR